MARSKRRNRRKNRRHRQARQIGLGMESLESRQMMAVSPVSLHGGILDIDGSVGADEVVVEQIGSSRCGDIF